MLSGSLPAHLSVIRDLRIDQNKKYNLREMLLVEVYTVISRAKKGAKILLNWAKKEATPLCVNLMPYTHWLR